MKTLLAYFLALTVVGVLAANYDPMLVKEIRTPRIKPIDTVKLPDTPPELIVTDQSGNKVPLRVISLDVKVNSVGAYCNTTLDMVFENPNDRILEGELVMPLAETQSISRFAMDINGNLREGVAIEKEKGRAVYEATIRQKIDPGLVEMVKGNSFRTRIYPIPAKGTKRVVVAYEEELPNTQAGLLYRLPLRFTYPLKSYNFEMFSFNDFTYATSVAGASETDKLQKASDNNTFALTGSFKNYNANYVLTCNFPSPTDAPDVLTAKTPTITIFAATVAVPAFDVKKTIPRLVTLAWDNSGSAAQRNMTSDFDLITRYFAAVEDCAVDVVPFNIAVAPARRFTVRSGNAIELINYLRSIENDGATQIGALNFDAFAGTEVLVFTDGVSNFGEATPAVGSKRVNIISSGASAEHLANRAIAERTGGAYINLVTTDAESGVNDLMSPMVTFRPDLSRFSGATQMYPSEPVVAGDVFTLTGTLLAGQLDATFVFECDGERKSVTVTSAGAPELDESTTLQRLWALKKIEQLRRNTKTNTAEIVATAKQFTIVTPLTSLIILDRMEDYVQHRIVPPKELQSEYFAKVGELDSNKNVSVQSQLEKVVTLFTAKKEWYLKEYSPAKKKESKLDGLLSEETLSAGNGGEMEVDVRNRSTRRESPRGYTMSAPTSAGRVNGAGSSANKSMDADDIVSVTNQLVARADDAAKDMEAPKNIGSMTTVAGYDEKTVYIDSIRNAGKANYWKAYMQQKKWFGTNPGFYLDVSAFFADQGMKAEGLRVLSNIAEMELENHQLLRIMARRLEQLEYYNYAIATFKDVLEIRGEEPQSYRDLALALGAAKRYQEAADMLYSLVTKPWDGRFPEIELIALQELNAFVGESKGAVNTSAYDKRLLFAMPVDVRIVLNWDADNCDMDLWVVDPRKEKCFYSHPLTQVGGRLSRDLTGGYGPEEFLLKKAVDGKYKIQVNYYGDSQQRVAGPTTIQMEMYTHYGTPYQVKKNITLQVKSVKEVIDIGELAFAAKQNQN